VAEWFVQNVADAEWWVNEKFGARTMLVPHGSQVGARVHVLVRASASSSSKAESGGSGLGTTSICAPGTTHSFVGAGGGPCVMVTVGRRGEGETILYARDDTALSHGAVAEQGTDKPSEAYAPFPTWESGRPGGWDSLPWNR
jgi:hypothetical protein